jgi:hypothetical protein
MVCVGRSSASTKVTGEDLSSGAIFHASLLAGFTMLVYLAMPLVAFGHTTHVHDRL